MVKLCYYSIYNFGRKYKSMDPKQFAWTEDQHVTVTNPTPEDYKFKVHSKEYQLGAGRSAKMPGYIAWVYVYGMASQLAQADGLFNRWNEEGFRKEYFERLVVGIDEIVQDIQEEPEAGVHVFDQNNKPELASDTPSATSVAADMADEEEGDEPSQPTKEEAGKVKPMTAKAKDGRPAKV
jgi:hypothetical protein